MPEVAEDVADGEKLREGSKGREREVAFEANALHAGDDNGRGDEAQGEGDVDPGDAPAEAERRGLGGGDAGVGQNPAIGGLLSAGRRRLDYRPKGR